MRRAGQAASVASFADALLSGEQADRYRAHSGAPGTQDPSLFAPSSDSVAISAHYQQQDLDDLFIRPRSHTPSMQQQQARMQAMVHAQAQRKNQRKQSISRAAGQTEHGPDGAAAAAASSPLIQPKAILLHSHSALVLNAPSLMAGLYASGATGAVGVGVPPSSRAQAAFNLASSLSGLSLMQQPTPAVAADASSPPVVLDAQGFMVQISPGQRDAAIRAAGDAALAASSAGAVATPVLASPPPSRRRPQLHMTPAAGCGSHAQAFYESMVPVTGAAVLPVPLLAGARHAFLIHQPLTSITADTVLGSSTDPQGRRNMPSGITFNGVNMSSERYSAQPTTASAQQSQAGRSGHSSVSGSSLLAFDPSSVSTSTAPPASAAPVPTARPGTLKAVPLEAIRAPPPSGSRALLALAHAPVTSYKLDLSAPAASVSSASSNELPRLATSGESEQLAALRRQHASPFTALSTPGASTGTGSTAVLRPRQDPSLILTATGQTLDAVAIARARKLLALTLAQTKPAKGAGTIEEQNSNTSALGSQSERRPAVAMRTAAALSETQAPRSTRAVGDATPSFVPRVVLASAPDSTGSKTARVAAPSTAPMTAARTFGVARSTSSLQSAQQPRKRLGTGPPLLPSLPQPVVGAVATATAAPAVPSPSAAVDSPAAPIAEVPASLSSGSNPAPVSAAVAPPATHAPAVISAAVPDSASSPGVGVTAQPALSQPQSQAQPASLAPAPSSQASSAALRASPSAATLYVSSPSPSVIALSVAPAPVLAIPASAVADADSLLSALSVRRPPPEQKRYLAALHHSFAEMASANETHVLTQAKSVTAQALDHTALERAELERAARAQARVLQNSLDGMERAVAESKVQADAAWSQSVSEIDRVYSARNHALQARLAQIAAHRQARSQRLADELAAQREEAEVEEIAEMARAERLEELRTLETKLSAHASRTAQRWAREWSDASAQREAAAAQAARDQLVKQEEIRAFVAAQYEAKRAQAKAGVLWVRVIRGHELGEEPMQHGPISRGGSSSDLHATAAASSSAPVISRLPKLSTCCLSFSLRFKAASLANDSCFTSFFGRDGSPSIDEVFKLRVSNAALQTLTIAIQAAQPKQVEIWERELRAALACSAQLSTAQQLAGETTQMTQLDQLAQAGLLRVHSAITVAPSSLPSGAALGAAPSPSPVPLLPTPSSHRRHVSFQSHARSASSSGGASTSLHEFAAEMQQRSVAGSGSAAKSLGTIGEATPEASRAASKLSIHTPTANSSRNSHRSPSPHTPLQTKQHSDPASPTTPSLPISMFPAPPSGSRRGLRTHSRQISSGGMSDSLSGTPSGSSAASALVGPVSVSSLSSSALSQLQSVAHLRPRSEVLSRVEEVGSVEIALASIRSAPHGRVAGEFTLHTPMTEQKRKEREMKRAADKRKQAVSKMQQQEQEDGDATPAPARRMVRHSPAVGSSSTSSSSGPLQTIRCGSVTVELWLLPLFDNSADAAAAVAAAGGQAAAPAAPRTIRSRLRIGMSELSAEEQRAIDAHLESTAEARAAASEMPVWNPEASASDASVSV